MKQKSIKNIRQELEEHNGQEWHMRMLNNPKYPNLELIEYKFKQYLNENKEWKEKVKWTVLQRNRKQLRMIKEMRRGEHDWQGKYR